MHKRCHAKDSKLVDTSIRSLMPTHLGANQLAKLVSAPVAAGLWQWIVNQQAADGTSTVPEGLKGIHSIIGLVLAVLMLGVLTANLGSSEMILDMPFSILLTFSLSHIDRTGSQGEDRERHCFGGFLRERVCQERRVQRNGRTRQAEAQKRCFCESNAGCLKHRNRSIVCVGPSRKIRSE